MGNYKNTLKKFMNGSFQFICLPLLMVGVMISATTNLSAVGIYLEPGDGTFNKDQPITIVASEAPWYVSPNGEACCGGEGDGVYEFYDIQYTGWSGDVVGPGGSGAGLDTSTPGSKNVTCYGEMRFRCSGGEDIVGPVSCDGSGSYTVNPSTDNLVAEITPNQNFVILAGESVNLSTMVSGGVAGYSHTWTMNGASPSTSSASSVTPSYSASGTYTAAVTVRDSSSPQQQSVTKQVSINVMKITQENFDPDDNLWWFNGQTGLTVGNVQHPSYTNKGTLTLEGAPAGNMITWEIVDNAKALNFSNGLNSIQGTATSQQVVSAGFTPQGQKVEVHASVNGKTASIEFYVLAPTTLTATFQRTPENLNPINAAVVKGYKEVWTNTITDQNGGAMLDDLGVGEDFPAVQNKNNSNWPMGANARFGFSGGEFDDTYVRVGNPPGYSPSSVNPGDPNEATVMTSVTQVYKVGGFGKGPTMDGYQTWSKYFDFCRGKTTR